MEVQRCRGSPREYLETQGAPRGAKKTRGWGWTGETHAPTEWDVTGFTRRGSGRGESGVDRAEGGGRKFPMAFAHERGRLGDKGDVSMIMRRDEFGDCFEEIGNIGRNYYDFSRVRINLNMVGQCN